MESSIRSITSIWFGLDQSAVSDAALRKLVTRLLDRWSIVQLRHDCTISYDIRIDCIAQAIAIEDPWDQDELWRTWVSRNGRRMTDGVRTMLVQTIANLLSCGHTDMTDTMRYLLTVDPESVTANRNILLYCTNKKSQAMDWLLDTYGVDLFAFDGHILMLPGASNYLSNRCLSYLGSRVYYLREGDQILVACREPLPIGYCFSFYIEPLWIYSKPISAKYSDLTRLLSRGRFMSGSVNHGPNIINLAPRIPRHIDTSAPLPQILLNLFAMVDSRRKSARFC